MFTISINSNNIAETTILSHLNQIYFNVLQDWDLNYPFPNPMEN